MSNKALERWQRDQTALADEDESAWETVVETAIYMPEWRDIMPDGSLGPWFGPRTPGEYDAEIDRYQMGTGGGGLWDYEVAPDRRRRNREDLERLRTINLAELPRRELEVFYAYFVDGRSAGNTARELGIARDTVKSLIARVRARAA